MGSELVIKVKYGDMLRRFSVPVHGNVPVDLDMSGLEGRILHLFKLYRVADLIITYVDEDNDVVTLVNDDDLLDAFKQCLNPLRISVHVNNIKFGRFGSRSSRSSTPTSGSSQIQSHPFSGTLTNLTNNLMSNAASQFQSHPSLNLRHSMFTPISKSGLSGFMGLQHHESKSLMDHKTQEDTMVSKVSYSKIFDSADGGVTRAHGGPLTPTTASIDFPKPSYLIGESSIPSQISGTAQSPVPLFTFDQPLCKPPSVWCHPPTSHVSLNSQKKNPILPNIGLGASYDVQVHFDNIGRTFHRGIKCDGCGVYPITGTRFKSKLINDYDLCSICIPDMGNMAEFIRMDKPMSYPYSHFQSALLADDLISYGNTQYCPKLDSMFIRDMNIQHETPMAPTTFCIRVLRMKNNGSIAWPHGTHLLWIGGDKLTNKSSVKVEIPVDGCPVGKALDVAVDCKSPDSPGHYFSYWRLAIPSGQQFGQRVCVRIQVLQYSPAERVPYLNLNVPLESTGPKSDEHFIKNQDSDIPTNVPSELPLLVSHHMPDLSVVPSKPALSEVNNSDLIEQILLKDLEEMGFKNKNFNKKILRKNKYNLERSVYDLSDVSEWDPMLQELHEMGFCDRETNKKLLIENKGSIKRVVLDFISKEE